MFNIHAHNLEENFRYQEIRVIDCLQKGFSQDRNLPRIHPAHPNLSEHCDLTEEAGKFLGGLYFDESIALLGSLLLAIASNACSLLVEKSVYPPKSGVIGICKDGFVFLYFFSPAAGS